MHPRNRRMPGRTPVVETGAQQHQQLERAPRCPGACAFAAGLQPRCRPRGQPQGRASTACLSRRSSPRPLLLPCKCDRPCGGPRRRGNGAPQARPWAPQALARGGGMLGPGCCRAGGEASRDADRRATSAWRARVPCCPAGLATACWRWTTAPAAWPSAPCTSSCTASQPSPASSPTLSARRWALAARRARATPRAACSCRRATSCRSAPAARRPPAARPAWAAWRTACAPRPPGGSTVMAERWRPACWCWWQTAQTRWHLPSSCGCGSLSSGASSTLSWRWAALGLGRGCAGCGRSAGQGRSTALSWYAAK